MNRESPGLVLFVDDDPDVRAANAQSLELAGLEVRCCATAEEAWRRLDVEFQGVVVSDIRMPGSDGRELHRRARAIDPEIPVILITGHADVAEAVEAMREGVYDFLAKPYAAERLLGSVRRALAMRGLVLDNRRLRAAVGRPQAGSALLGESAPMQALRASVEQIATAEVDVLIEGETGVGKELLARTLAALGRGRHAPFVVVDCAAPPGEHLDRELFGHEAGAFSGALRRRPGRIESAHRGLLFLDNVESAPDALQTALLRALEAREVLPLGSSQPRRVEFRAVAAANLDLARLVEAGRFRRELYYRLDVVRVRIPPLRERRSDIPLLFGHFVAEAERRFARVAPRLSDRVRRHLLEHDWPGNVRELRHHAERFVLGFEDAGPGPAEEAGQALPLRMQRVEAQLLREALAAAAGDVGTALRLLGIPRKTFYDKLKRHALRSEDFRRVRPKREPKRE